MAMGGGIPSDAPANTTSENEAFGGSTDQEKFNFCSSFITAINMIADGTFPLEKIAKYSGLSLKEVEDIKKSVNI